MSNKTHLEICLLTVNINVFLINLLAIIPIRFWLKNTNKNNFKLLNSLSNKHFLLIIYKL
jgi:hypothetical protein